MKEGLKIRTIKNVKICLAVVVFLLQTALISAAVEINVPTQYSTIQAAIDAAVDGDTVLVAEGTYYENIDFLGKAIRVKSEAGPQNTTIDGRSVGNVVSFISHETSDSVLDGFTITNAGGSNNHGIKCYKGSATIINNIITENAGWGIVLYKSDSIIRNNIIYGEPDFDIGPFSAIHLVESNALIEDNTFFATDENGNIDAIYISKVNSFEARSILISRNYIWGRIYISVWPLLNIEISNNVIIIENGFSSAINSNIEDDSNLLIANNTIYNGGGIYLQRGGTMTRIKNNIITGCNQGIESPSGYFEIFNNNLWNNEKNYYGIPDLTGLYGNISTDPLFVDFIDANFRLRPDSPCIDAGDPNSDFGLEPEPDGGRINIGAYGNTPEATCKGGLVLQSYNQVSKTRVGRTLFDYEFTVTLNNNSDVDVSNVELELLDASNNVQIVDSQVSFEHISAGESAVSDDSFTIRVDRSVPIDVTKISWRASYEAEGLTQEIESLTKIELGDAVAGDITGDGSVDFEDISRLIDKWLWTGGTGEIAEDVFEDGIVNFRDLGKLVEFLE